MNRLFNSLVVLCLLVVTLPAQAQVDETRYEVAMARNIPYATSAEAHPRRVLDLFVPDNLENYPVLMFVSGGGWTQGSKDWIANIGVAFARQGIGVATVDHRLVPEVTYEGQVDDLAHAFAWLRSNIARAGGDPDHIVIGGHSAGAHLITLLSVDSRFLGALGHDIAEISGVLPVSGVFRFTPSVRGSGILPDVPDALRTASPLTYIHADLPPFLILVADGDSSSTQDQAAALQSALEAAGVRVELAEIANRDHFNITQAMGTPRDPATQVMLTWMRELWAEGENTSTD